MTGTELVTILSAALVGAVVADRIGAALIVRAPEKLVRANIDGEPVPVVLGIAAVGGAIVPLVALIVWTLARDVEGPGVLRSMLALRIGLATLVVIVLLGAAGLWDDLRGHELPRGFAGHLGSLRRGRLTGGLVKIVVALIAGCGAGLLLGAAFLGSGLVLLVQVVLLVGLSANLVNLLDTAPGRAGKVALASGVLLIAFGLGPWAAAGAGLFGALAACLPADLKAGGMLGDAGSNPLGGAIGLGLAVSLPSAARWVVIALLLVVNLISERYSFSTYIARSAALNRLDMLGRDQEP